MDEKLKKKYEEILAQYTGIYLLDQNLGADLSDMVKIAREFDHSLTAAENQISGLIALLAETQEDEAYWKKRWSTDTVALQKSLANLKCDKCGDNICPYCTALGDFMHLCYGCDSESSED